ncbi:MAG: DUF2231 domain-containing protein [Nitrospirales bacterium]
MPLGQVPGMLREELWHPMVVHFPIALLLFGVLLYTVGFAVPNSWKSHTIFSARVLLTAGILGAWLAIWTGGRADRVVGRTLCDPLVLEAHENYAYWMAWLFTVAVVLDYGSIFLKKARMVSFLRIACALAFAVGAVLTGTIGHLGAKLVYQQGAAVYQPSGDCSEFVE